MALDRYTLLREMGYYGSLAEMEVKYLQNVTGLNTIGEQLDKALDAAMARTFLEITSGGSPSIAVPGEINASGTPSATTYLRGDGTWSTPAASAADYNTLTNKPANFPADWNTTVTNKPATFTPSAHNQLVSTLSDITLAAIRTFLTSADLTTARAALGITAANIGLGAVNNTSDADKPVSTATRVEFQNNVRAIWPQVGNLYPTPLPRADWKGFQFIGQLDPDDQVGLGASFADFRDGWTQMP